MDSNAIVEDVAHYFRTEHWLRLLDALEYPYAKSGHIHCHVEGSLAIEALDEVVTSYLEICGWPAVRRPNWMCVNQDTYVLQGITPRDKLNWELVCKWNPAVTLAPAAPRESNCNLLLWGCRFMNEWYKDFDFRPVTAREEEALRAYFGSAHWNEGLALLLDRETVAHAHINVKTSVHPGAIERIALESLRSGGWEIDWAYPTLYSVPGGTAASVSTPRAGYLAKIVFLASKPMQIAVDLAWKFDADAILEPDLAPRLRPDRPGYDVFYQSQLRDLRQAHPWTILTQPDLERLAGIFQLRANRYRK